MTKPIDKSKLTIEQRTRQVLKTNPPKYVRGGAVLLKKLPNQALPNTSNIWDRNTYRTGDGEVKQQVRPGADDHFKYKSHGDSV